MNLNGKTTIPLWSVLAAVPVIVGFVFWLSTVASLGQATAKTVDKLEGVIYKIQADVAFLRGREEQREKQKNQ